MRVEVGVHLRALAFGGVEWDRKWPHGMFPVLGSFDIKERQNKRSPSEVSSYQNSWWMTASLGLYKKCSNTRIHSDDKYQESQNLYACPQNYYYSLSKHINIQETSKRNCDDSNLKWPKAESGHQCGWCQHLTSTPHRAQSKLHTGHCLLHQPIWQGTRKYICFVTEKQ